MDQTKFDLYQTILQVANDLHLPEFLRKTKGEQFTISLMAFRANGEVAPIDIYVDRAEPGKSSLKYKAEDGTQVHGATASIDPDGERFRLDIVIEKGAARPFVRVSRDMLRLLGERQAVEMEGIIEQIIAEGDKPAD